MDGRDGPDPVTDLLTAAAAPARAGELAGERAALAAFRSARLAPVHRRRRRSMTQMMGARLLTARAAVIAAVAATTVGGVAFAASGGLSAGHGVPPATVPASPGSAFEPQTSTATGSGGVRSTEAGVDLTRPDPSLVGLCHAYTAGAGADHGKASQSPAFRALIDTAGGADRVPGYCARLLAAAHLGDSDERPGDDPGGHHGNPPNNHTPGRPPEHPGH
jgi:hypothetical protein